MSKLNIFRNPKFWAIHLGSPHHISHPDYNELILVRNCKTEFSFIFIQLQLEGILAKESSPRTKDINHILGRFNEIFTSLSSVN